MSLRKLFNKADLKSKIVVAAVFIIVITTIAGSGFFYTQIKTVLFQNLQERGETICENLSHSAKYSVLTEDKVFLTELAKNTMRSDDVVYVVIANETGKVLAEKNIVKIPDIAELRKSAVQTQQCAFAVTQTPDGEQIYCFCFPIIAKKTSLAELIGVEPEHQSDNSAHLKGVAHIGLSPQKTITRLNYMLRGIIFLTIAIIGCGILFAFSFVRLIMKPIEQMAHAASKVAAGDLAQKVSVESEDEIGQFASQFNIMTEALKNRELQLKESFEQLSASEDRYRVFIQNSSESIWCFEPKDGKPYPKNCTEDDMVRHMLSDSIVVECNDAMAKLYNGNRREDILGRSLGCFMPPNNPENTENLHAFIKNGYRLVDVEEEQIDPSGQLQVILSNFVGTTTDGQLLRVWVIQRNVSKIKRAEQKQAELFEQIKNVNQELKDFAYVASHDLKAPLRGIKTLAEWIAADYADKFDEAGKEQFKLLTNRVDRMHNLIDGILQYSRVGRIHETPVTINLNTLIPDIIDMIAPPENIKITIEDNLPNIAFEETRIRQVFQNLISNAVKYMDKPEGKIHIGCTDEDGFCKFNVTDNGPGIEEKYYDKIFRIFQTLPTNNNQESTGVGLALVKKIVELYSGKVWVESKPGQGSSFFFTVLKEPQRISAKYASLHYAQSGAQNSSFKSGTKEPKGVKIIVSAADNTKAQQQFST